jgi:carbon-monoxide dehydrogenase iron sulfur subunit
MQTMDEQRRIFVRVERCVGCRSCELACAVAHARSDSLAAAVEEEPPPKKRLFVEAFQGHAAPIHCRHCEVAPCVRVCPTGALFSDPASGLVHYQENRCIGCFLCAMSCPFGVIRPDPEHRFIVKCDFCPDRTVPACVSACPTRALQYQTEAEYEAARRQEVSRLWWDR